MRKIFRRFATFILVVCFFGLLPVQAQDKMNIAVIDFEAQGGLTPQEAAVLTNRLRSKLVTTDVFIMLDRGRMDEILQEQGLQLTGCTSTECAVEMGRLLNVQQIVSGSIGMIGKLYTIDIVLINVETAQIIKSITRDFKGEIEGIIDLMGSIANELAALERPQIVQVASADEFGLLEITSIPARSSVYIDGIMQGLTPFKLNKMKSGEHTLKLLKNGYMEHEQTFTIIAGQTNYLEISLSKLLNLYRIGFSSVPSQAEVFLDNRFVGKTPVSNKFEEGSYLVRMHLENYIDYKKQILLQKDTQLEAKLKYTDEYRQQLAKLKKGGRSGKKLLLLGSAAAVIGGGVYYYMTQIAPTQDTGFPKPPRRP